MWIRVKLEWLGKFSDIKDNLVPIDVDQGPDGYPYEPPTKVFLRKDISTWINENNVTLESSYEPNYLESIENDLQFLAIRFADPNDRLMFIMRFIE